MMSSVFGSPGKIAAVRYWQKTCKFGTVVTVAFWAAKAMDETETAAHETRTAWIRRNLDMAAFYSPSSALTDSLKTHDSILFGAEKPRVDLAGFLGSASRLLITR